MCVCEREQECVCVCVCVIVYFPSLVEEREMLSQVIVLTVKQSEQNGKERTRLISSPGRDFTLCVCESVLEVCVCVLCPWGKGGGGTQGGSSQPFTPLTEQRSTYTTARTAEHILKHSLSVCVCVCVCVCESVC